MSKTIEIVEKRLENLRSSEASKVIFDETKTAIYIYIFWVKLLNIRSNKAFS